MIANPAQEGVYSFRSRIRFTLHRRYFAGLIDTLNEQTITIKQIVDGIILLHSQQMMHITESSQQLADHFRTIQDLVRSLFTAIERGCHPGCHRLHEAMISLDNFLALDAQRSQGLGNEQTEVTSFEIYISTIDQHTNEVRCHKTVVQAEGKRERLSDTNSS